MLNDTGARRNGRYLTTFWGCFVKLGLLFVIRAKRTHRSVMTNELLCQPIFFLTNLILCSLYC
jgi:hypothetical protein